jgi:hypothetical protein
MELLNDDVMAAVKHIEVLMNSKFGDKENPLLVSVRSGARASMPGMMDTILNLGLNDEVAEGMVKKTQNPHFVYDSYRRFVQMYGDVVLEMKPVNKTDIDPFEEIIEKVKAERGVKLDKDLNVDELKKLVQLFKKAIKERTGKDFPNDPIEQLWGRNGGTAGSQEGTCGIVYPSPHAAIPCCSRGGHHPYHRQCRTGTMGPRMGRPEGCLRPIPGAASGRLC